MPCNRFNGVEAELLYSGHDIEFYLNAFTLLFSDSENAGYTEVVIGIADQKYTYPAERLAGGQRLLLPAEAQQLIIAALIDNASVELSAGRYQAILIPDNFASIYAKNFAPHTPLRLPNSLLEPRPDAPVVPEPEF